MAELLRDRRGRGGRADRIAVRGLESDFADAGGRARIRPPGAAFSTPTIVHFSAVLALAGILSAPWERIGLAALSWGVLGAGGFRVRVDRHPADPSAEGVPARIRGLVVPRRAADGRVRGDGGLAVVARFRLPVKLCSGSALRRCCYCLPGFTTRGTQSRITSSPRPRTDRGGASHSNRTTPAATETLGTISCRPWGCG